MLPSENHEERSAHVGEAGRAQDLGRSEALHRGGAPEGVGSAECEPAGWFELPGAVGSVGDAEHAVRVAPPRQDEVVAGARDRRPR